MVPLLEFPMVPLEESRTHACSTIQSCSIFLGELIGYPWSSVRPSIRRRPSSTMTKNLLLRNCVPDHSQILYGASLGRGNEILFAASWSHHMTKMAATPIYGKNPSKSSSPEPVGRFPRNLVCSIVDSCPS